MKKKWELLKYAYDNYPAGTRFKNLGCDDMVSESSGKFHLDSDGVRDSETYCFVLGTEDKWAEIIVNDGMGENAKSPVSLLSGKVAIQVNNEREFKLLMEHYKEKGWKWRGGYVLDTNDTDYVLPTLVDYHDKFQVNSKIENPGKYKVIPFADFAAEVGIAWIEEQNRPKEITIQLFNEYQTAKVRKDSIDISVSSCAIRVKPSDIEDILHAIKSLQCDKTTSK